MKAASFLLTLVVAAAAAGDVREQVTVELIEIPVYVVGGGGNPIRGLTRDAFELRVNGRKQPIEYFDAIDFAPRTAADAQSSLPVQRAERERRLYLLLFDAAYSSPGFLARAQRAAHYAVEHFNPATDLFAVATYSASKGTQLVTAFIADRPSIHRAIQTLSISNARDPLTIAVSSDERMQWLMGTKWDSEIEDQMKGGGANQEIEQQPAKNRVDSFLRSLGELAARLGGLKGQKHVLLLSTGFDSALVNGGASPTASSPLQGGGLDGRTTAAMYAMFGAFRAAGVFLDSIDVAGIRPKWDMSRRATRIDESQLSTSLRTGLNVNESLQMISEGTGGEFSHDASNLGQAMVRLETAQEAVYILGFNRGRSRTGEVSVRVKGVGSDARISYRHGFAAPARREDVDPLQLADILMNDVPQSGLTLPIRVHERDVEIAIRTEEVRPQLVKTHPYVDVLLYVFDEHGTAVEGAEKRIRFDDTQTNDLTPVVLRKHLDLAPGRYVVKAIAHIESTSSLGFARANVTINGAVH